MVFCRTLEANCASTQSIHIVAALRDRKSRGVDCCFFAETPHSASRSPWGACVSFLKFGRENLSPIRMRGYAGYLCSQVPFSFGVLAGVQQASRLGARIGLSIHARSLMPTSVGRIILLRHNVVSAQCCEDGVKSDRSCGRAANPVRQSEALTSEGELTSNLSEVPKLYQHYLVGEAFGKVFDVIAVGSIRTVPQGSFGYHEICLARNCGLHSPGYRCINTILDRPY